MIRPLLCRIFGHRWRVLRVNYPRWVMEGHANPLAGKDADCARCGAMWRDHGGELPQPRPLGASMHEAAEGLAAFRAVGTCSAADAAGKLAPGRRRA